MLLPELPDASSVFDVILSSTFGKSLNNGRVNTLPSSQLDDFRHNLRHWENLQLYNVLSWMWTHVTRRNVQTKRRQESLIHGPAKSAQSLVIGSMSHPLKHGPLSPIGCFAFRV